MIRQCTVANAVRCIARHGQYGHVRTPATIYVNADYSSYCWSPARWDMTFEQWQAAASLVARYQRFINYITETLPCWTVVERINFADNSVEVVERARDGRTRQRMVVAPSGDLCF